MYVGMIRNLSNLIKKKETIKNVSTSFKSSINILLVDNDTVNKINKKDEISYHGIPDYDKEVNPYLYDKKDGISYHGIPDYDKEVNPYLYDKKDGISYHGIPDYDKEVNPYLYDKINNVVY